MNKILVFVLLFSGLSVFAQENSLQKVLSADEGLVEGGSSSDQRGFIGLGLSMKSNSKNGSALGLGFYARTGTEYDYLTGEIKGDIFASKMKFDDQENVLELGTEISSALNIFNLNVETRYSKNVNNFDEFTVNPSWKIGNGASPQVGLLLGKYTSKFSEEGDVNGATVMPNIKVQGTLFRTRGDKKSVNVNLQAGYGFGKVDEEKRARALAIGTIDYTSEGVMIYFSSRYDFLKAKKSWESTGLLNLGVKLPLTK